MDNKFKYDFESMNSAVLYSQKSNMYAIDAIANIKKLDATIKTINIANKVDSTNIITELNKIDNYASVIKEASNEIILDMVCSGNYDIVKGLQTGEITIETLISIAPEYMMALAASDPTYYTKLKTLSGDTNALQPLYDLGLPRDFKNQVNLAMINYLIESDLMYTGKGAITGALMVEGFFAMFGYKLGYQHAGHFDRDEDGLYLGTKNKDVCAMDCTNFVDWIYRFVGMNSSGNPTEMKYAYAGWTPWGRCTVDSSYTGEIASFAEFRSFFDFGHKDTCYAFHGKAGDLLVREGDGKHNMVIVENTGTGYWIVESTSGSDYSGNTIGGCVLVFRTYEQLASSEFSVTNMDNFFKNITPTCFDGGTTGTSNMLRPETIIAQIQGLDQAHQNELIRQFNERNKSSIEAEARYITVTDGSTLTTRVSTITTPTNTTSVVDIPDNLEQTHYTATGYDKWLQGGAEMQWDSGTNQYKVSEMWKEQGSRFKNGIAVVTIDGEDRYLVAVTSKLGVTGDAIDVQLENGQVIKCLVADQKGSGDSTASQYGHIINGKLNVLEFEVERQYMIDAGGNNPETKTWGLEWDSTSPVDKVTNKGNYIGNAKRPTVYIPTNTPNSSYSGNYSGTTTEPSGSNTISGSTTIPIDNGTSPVKEVVPDVPVEQTVTVPNKEVVPNVVVTPSTQTTEVKTDVENTTIIPEVTPVTPVAEKKPEVIPITPERPSVTPTTQPTKVVEVEKVNETHTQTVVPSYTGYTQTYTNPKPQEEVIDIPEVEPIISNEEVVKPEIPETPVTPIEEPVIPIVETPAEEVVVNNTNSNVGKVIGGIAATAAVVGAGVAAKTMYDKQKGKEYDDEYVEDNYDEDEYVEKDFDGNEYIDSSQYVVSLNQEEENNNEESSVNDVELDEYGLPIQKEVIIPTDDVEF